MTMQMTMTMKFEHCVSKCLMELLGAVTMVLLCSQGFSYPGQS